MNNYLAIQNELLILVKSKTDSKLVDILMDTLHISLDSAYRRIRLEKIFTLDEIIKISNTFNISIDRLISHDSSDSVLFSFPFKSSHFNLEEYFTKILHHLQKINIENGTMYYSAKDIPIFHFFQDKKLLAFKFHYWLNTMNHEDEIAKKKFSYDLIPAKLADVTKKIYSVYTQIRTHEIWNFETLTRTSSQITYYYEMGLITIKQAEDLQLRLIDFINHIEEECRIGKKYFMDKGPLTKDENYVLYFNEIISADNSIYAEYGNIKESFLPHIVLNYMTTDNIQYSEYNKSVFDTVINKSTLISKVNEKERRKFFKFNKDFVNKQISRLQFI
jgi:hypothetical protein